MRACHTYEPTQNNIRIYLERAVFFYRRLLSKKRGEICARIMLIIRQTSHETNNIRLD
jgi:hypothetical protein